jgi:hypothetical protein
MLQGIVSALMRWVASRQHLLPGEDIGGLIGLHPSRSKLQMVSWLITLTIFLIWLIAGLQKEEPSRVGALH